MKSKLALSAIVAAVAVFSQGAFAQASSPTRAEVKAEAKTGSLAPAGQGPMASVPATTDKTRAERKAMTKADAKGGALKPAGDAADMKKDGAKENLSSDKTRAERKAQTKADVKAGKTVPAGEAAMPIADPKKP